MECRDCKYVTEHNGAFFCMGQKNMPSVTGNGVCEHWKPTYITNYDRIISKTPEELAAQIVEWIEGIDPISGTLYDNDTDGWLDWLKQEATDGT